MDEEMIYVLPTKAKKILSKKRFIIFSVILSVVCACVVSILIIPALGGAVCGFVPTSLVSLSCAIGQVAGGIYYIKKHKYVHGENYEYYQIINSAIYGIQNVLRVILIVLLVNICAVPIFILFVFVYTLYLFRKMFRR